MFLGDMGDEQMRRLKILKVFVFLLTLFMASLCITNFGFAQSDDSGGHENSSIDAVRGKARIVRITTEDGTIISIYDKAFLIERPRLPHYPPILHVQGTPFEMGYQHGILLADRITEGLSAVGSPFFFMFGGWSPESGKAPTQGQLQAGYNICLSAAQKYFDQPMQQKVPDYYSELQGIAAGLKAGGSPVTFDDLLIAACMGEFTQMPDLLAKLAPKKTSLDISMPEFSKGCSDFAAWGEATDGGKLIHGTNFDMEGFDFLKRIVVLVAKPESGNAFLGVIWPGSPWPMRGMSEAGITTGEPTSVSSDNNIVATPEVPHSSHMRRVLQYANSTQDAIDIMKDLGGTTGWNIFTADGNIPTAVDIEVSCTKMGVIYPAEGANALWSTNHYNAYPKWQGYPKEGANLVKDQMEYWGVSWEAVNTIEKWQKWMSENKATKPGGTWARYERLRELLKQNYGQITAEKVTSFMSDPILSSAGKRTTLSGPVVHLHGLERPIISQRLAADYSCVFVPADSMAYIAAGAEPAQAGKYWPISLKEHLALMSAFEKEHVCDRFGKLTENILQSWARGAEQKAAKE